MTDKEISEGTIDLKKIELAPQNFANDMAASIYSQIRSILDSYMDLTEPHKVTIALWAMAATAKNYFETMPILYINAPKASGKSRLLKILAEIIPNSMLTISLTEANLFRTPQQRGTQALFIDEAEHLSSRESGCLRELINACYKRGMKVLRQHKNKKTETYETEEFELFLALGLANIWGLESVMESRSITLILDKSVNPTVTKKVEAFQYDRRFADVRTALSAFFSASSASNTVTSVLGDRYQHIISYINDIYTVTAGVSGFSGSTVTTVTNNGYHNPNCFTETEIFEKIMASDLNGRSLELWLPLLTVASIISKTVFEDTLDIAEVNTYRAQEADIVEDRDSRFLVFLSDFIASDNDEEFLSIARITQAFRVFEEAEKHDKFPSAEWVGRALRRLNVVRSKRHIGTGREVSLNKSRIIEKAQKIGIKCAFVPKKVEDFVGVKEVSV